MRWPWVKRSEMAKYRRMYNEQCALARGNKAMADEYRGSRDELRDALRRSDIERSDLQLKLLRISYGYPPFPDVTPPASPNPDPVAPAQEYGPTAITPDMTDEQVQATFVREGAELYGNNMRKITQHVELRQAEYYQFRSRKPILTDAEMAAATRVTQDLEAAINEGRAAAEREN